MSAGFQTPDPRHARRTTFVLLLWPEHASHQPPLWRGVVETCGGARRYFRTLAQLNQILVELSNWAEATAPPDENDG